MLRASLLLLMMSVVSLGQEITVSKSPKLRISIKYMKTAPTEERRTKFEEVLSQKMRDIAREFTQANPNAKVDEVSLYFTMPRFEEWQFNTHAAKWPELAAREEKSDFLSMHVTMTLTEPNGDESEVRASARVPMTYKLREVSRRNVTMEKTGLDGIPYRIDEPCVFYTFDLNSLKRPSWCDDFEESIDNKSYKIPREFDDLMRKTLEASSR